MWENGDGGRGGSDVGAGVETDDCLFVVEERRSEVETVGRLRFSTMVPRAGRGIQCRASDAARMEKNFEGVGD